MSYEKGSNGAKSERFVKSSNASKSDELELIPRQLLQLLSIISQPKQRQFKTTCKPNLKQKGLEEVEKWVNELTKEGTNADFEVTEKSIESSKLQHTLSKIKIKLTN